MSPETYLAFATATMILLVIPGPTILLVVSYALAKVGVQQCRWPSAWPWVISLR